VFFSVKYASKPLKHLADAIGEIRVLQADLQLVVRHLGRIAAAL